MSKPFACALLTLGVLQVACGSAPTSSPAKPAGPLRVVSTTGMIADLAARVAGPHAAVEALMGPGVDPHLYKASQGDVRRLSDADLILYNGLHLEGKMGEVLDKLSRQRPVVAVAEAISPDRLLRPTEFEGEYDPHVWFDVELWSSIVDPIATALAELDPAHAGDYRDRAGHARRALLELDAWALSRIAEIPAERRILVTAHDAFGYFGRRYGIRVVGLQGLSTIAEAGLQDMGRVVDIVVNHRVRAVFVESSVPRRSIEAVRAAVRTHGHDVSIGGELFSDAMGAAGTPEGTYTGMVRHNVDTIVNALK